MNLDSPKNDTSEKITEAILKDKEKIEEKQSPEKKQERNKTPKEREAEIAEEKANLDKKKEVDKKESAKKTKEILSEIERFGKEEKQEDGKEKKEKSKESSNPNKENKNNKSEERKIEINPLKSTTNGIVKIKEVLKKFIGRPVSFLFWGLLFIIAWAWEKIGKKGKK